MKKLAAILLIALFLFNLFGYKIWFYCASRQSDVSLEKALDQNRYNEKDLITIKIPLSLPYQTSWSDFERYDGEVTLNGRIYKYVKRKVEDGNLILLCLPDQSKMHLEAAKNNYVSNINDIQNTKKQTNSKSPSGKILSLDYYQNSLQHTVCLYSNVSNNAFLHQLFPLTYSIISSPEQPPESV